MKIVYKFQGRHGSGQYMWKAYRNGIFVGRYVAMIERFWSGEPLPNAFFYSAMTSTSTNTHYFTKPFSG